MKLYYLAYGSNLNIAQMKNRCPHAKRVGATILHDYELEFRLYLTIKKSVGKQVPIGIWELDERDESNLDIYEGYPRSYRKEYLKVKIEDKEVDALVYIMNEEIRKVQPPTEKYLATCIKGYEDFGFDKKYLFEALAKSTL